MYTDAYEFRRSQRSQSVRDDYNTYSRKDYNYLPDTNQGSYTNNSLTMVTFDLSSIYNSSRFTDTNDLVIVIPVVMVAVAQTALAPIAVNPGMINLLSMKSNYVHLIHQCDVQINGKTCNDLQPFTNVLKNFEMLSEMSPSDLTIYGPTYGFGSELDNPRSIQFVPVSGNGRSGTGLTNNVPFGRLLPSATVSASSDVQQTASTAQGDSTLNKGISSRLNNFVDTTGAATGQNIYGAGGILPLERCKSEFKPTFEVVNGTHAVWYDYAIIRLGSLLESLRNIGLTRRFDAVLRMYINTGALSVGVAAINTVAVNYGPALQQNSTFTNTCPFTINYFPGSAAADPRSVLPATTTQITAGLFIARPPSTTVTAGAVVVNLNPAGNTITHPLNNCRIYYSSIEMGDPQRALTYIESNRAKKVVYRNFVSNFITGVEIAGTYSSLIQSGLVNPVAIVVIPFISPSSLLTAGGHVPQYGSPYDTSFSSPVSLLNFQVTVGGVNQLNTTLQYTFENFMQHVSLYEQIAGTDFGVSCGLFDKKFWELNRHYVCLIRSKFADMDTPRNINISFYNNSNVKIDLMVFSVYLDSLIIDTDTGRITR